jgi:molybdate transport system substrate-binding protein
MKRICIINTKELELSRASFQPASRSLKISFGWVKRILIFILLATSVGLQAQTVRVAAAGNLRYILDDIKEVYARKSPSTKVEVTLSASGTLFQQIMNGANYDFFMAADKSFPDKLKEQGVASGEVKIYGYGKLVLYSNSVDVSKGIEILTHTTINHISVAKPEVAPYGERAIQCLKYYNMLDKVKSKIVYADNISAAAQYVTTGNAEVGFLALALVLAPDMKGRGKYVELDPKSYKPVEQACVLLKTWNKNPEATKFMKFVLSAECKPIFEKYGFIVP